MNDAGADADLGLATAVSREPSPTLSLRAPARRWRRWKLYGAILALGVVLSVAVLRQFQPTITVGRDRSDSERVPLDRIQHGVWTDLLSRYVDQQGNVDYAGWLRSPDDHRRLSEYLDHLSLADLARPAGKAERLAFWTNAYNAVTVYGILREYPTSSIQNHVAKVWGYNIWRDLRLRISGGTFSLGQIEHEQLRPLGEPRIHFAIVCASRGCPRLLNEAYIADRLDEQLARNTEAFFADETKCRFDREQRALQLSPILNWYASDFGSSPAARLRTIASWLPDDEARKLAQQGQLRIAYFDYDWSLNDQATATPIDQPPLPPL